jgi:hypothetical protein
MVIIPGYKTFMAIRFASSPVKYDRLRKNQWPEWPAVYLYRDETAFAIIAQSKGVLFNIYCPVLYFLVPL